MSDRPGDVKLLKGSASSATRILNERREVAAGLGNGNTRRRMKQLVKPSSISDGMRSAGVALILAPEPISAVPGAVMLGASIAAKKRGAPSSISSVLEETRKLLHEIGGSV